MLRDSLQFTVWFMRHPTRSDFSTSVVNGIRTARTSSESGCSENKIENFPVGVGHRACHELFSSFCLHKILHQNFFFSTWKFSVTIGPWNSVRLRKFSLRPRNLVEFRGLLSLEMFPFCQPGSISNPKIIFINFFQSNFCFSIFLQIFPRFFFIFFWWFFPLLFVCVKFLFEFLFSFVSNWI